MSQIKTVLYHGTISELSKIDVSKGHDRKDFGKGFYMATEKQQAIGMMHKKYNEAIRRNKNRTADFSEHLYEIKLNKEYFETLNIKFFESADMNWLDFILLCREKGRVPHNYDVVIGATADDNTMLCLKTYWDGFYGKTGTDEAKEILLRNLETENLGIQYFIAKQQVADKLVDRITEIDWR